MLLIWTIFGALVGALAAQRKGFSMVLGILGGMLLGPLALLMLFVTGVGGGDARRKCPFCAEWVKAEATICRHCHKGLTAVRARR